jgi:hypothetical protein
MDQKSLPTVINEEEDDEQNPMATARKNRPPRLRRIMIPSLSVLVGMI